MTTTFGVLSLDHAQVQWENHLRDLTPVEEVGGIFFKREDRFAPLGYGGINGSKLRQCIWLVSNYKKDLGARAVGIVSGASVKSPQLSMGAAVAKHFDLRCLLVIGSGGARVMEHENVALAAWFGAEFYVEKIAYNPGLQKRVRDLLATPTLREHFQLEYGITVDSTDDRRVERFHALGAWQVSNIPPEVETLVLPAGSCNSCTSVLYGIARERPKRLKNVLLFGIGPTRLDFIEQRLGAIERQTGMEIRRLFRREYHSHPDLAKAHNVGVSPSAPYRMVHYDLHATKFVDYQDEMPYRLQGIEFHPTYEGKVMTYLTLHGNQFREFWKSGRAMFWIIGSKPRRAGMASVVNRPMPASLPRWAAP